MAESFLNAGRDLLSPSQLCNIQTDPEADINRAPNILDPIPPDPDDSNAHHFASSSPPNNDNNDTNANNDTNNTNDNNDNNDNTDTNDNNNDQRPPPFNIDTNIDEDPNYSITSDEPTSTDSTKNTSQLLRQIGQLTNELKLERENNTTMQDNMNWYANQHHNDIKNLEAQIETLQAETDRLRQESHPTSNPTAPPPPSTSTNPSTIDPNILALIQQQQQMLSNHMNQSNKILAEFGDGIKSLKEATLKSAAAAEKQANETIAARVKKGPTNNKLPKFHNKPDDDFLDWYGDVLAILALSEWKDIYDTSTDDVQLTTTSTNASLSEHLYSSLRLALQEGNAGLTMKSDAELYRNKGCEFLRAMKPIFHSKWAPADHSLKLTNFYSMFCSPTESVNEYAN